MFECKCERGTVEGAAGEGASELFDWWEGERWRPLHPSPPGSTSTWNWEIGRNDSIP